MTLRVTSKGLGAYDLDVNLGKLTLCAAPSRSGKSSLTNAVTVGAIGHLPRLGKELSSTAKLMHGRSIDVKVQFDDGRHITRRLARQPNGGLTLETNCSWVPSKSKGDVHKAAAFALFGATPEDAAESLDIYSTLIKLTGQKRAARIQALLPGSQTPDELAYRVARYLYQALTDTPDDRMPEDHTLLRPAIKGYVETAGKEGQHVGQLAAAFDAFPTLRAKIADSGLSAARDWINAEKRDGSKLAREASQALNELKRRLQEIPEPKADEIEEHESRLRSLEQSVGAAKAARFQREQTVEKINLAETKVSKAKAAAAAALSARAAFETTKLAVLGTAKARVAEIDAALGALTLPAAVVVPWLAEIEADVARLEAINLPYPQQGGEPDVEALAEKIAAVQRDHDTIVPPAAVSVAAEEDALQVALTRLEQAKGTFVHFVLEQMDLIAQQAPPPAIAEISSRVTVRAAGERSDNLLRLEEQVEGARRALASKRALRDATQVTADAAIAKRAELTRELAGLREQLAVRIADIDAEHVEACKAVDQDRAALNEAIGNARARRSYARIVALLVDVANLIDHEARRTEPAAERARLVADIATWEAEDRATADGVTETAASLRGAEDARRSLGDMPADTGSADQSVITSRDEITRRLETMRSHRTLWEEHHRAVADMEARTDVQTVLTALEGAVKRVMAEEAVEHGGPLLEFMGRYLKAAGCTERPYVQATKDEVDFGWVVTEEREGQPPEEHLVSLEVMSGSELTLYLTGLIAAIMELRNVEVRLLLVEAESCDEPMLQKLLAGISGIADSITASIVNYPRSLTIVPAGWEVRAPNGAMVPADAARSQAA